MDPSAGDADAAAELNAKFADMIGRMRLHDLQSLAGQLLSMDRLAGLDARAGGPPANRRRDRRPDAVTLRVRVDLQDVKPPIWRRLELSSHLTLDELHQVIQTSFGWTDTHLHRFACGPSVWDRSSEIYLCPFDVEEGEDEHGVPEEDVRLDEVLVEVGDRLLYAYDYGDGWEHVVRLESVLEPAADAPRARCTGGRRAAPPEDCGGFPGYEELQEAGEIEDEALDLEQVNASL